MPCTRRNGWLQVSACPTAKVGLESGRSRQPGGRPSSEAPGAGLGKAGAGNHSLAFGPEPWRFQPKTRFTNI